MSGKMVSKIRIVRCPKCRQHLQEPTGYDVYKCGGCGTDLQAKKKSMAVNSESSIQEIDAAPRKHRVPPPREDSLKVKATTSSRECYLDGKDEYKGSQLVPFKFSDEEMENELDIYKLSLRRHRKFNKDGSNKIANCEIEEIDNGNLSLERPEEELICTSDEEGNDNKSAPISEVEIIESNLQEGDDEKVVSGSGEEDANEDKSAASGANHGMEVIGSCLEGVEDSNIGNLSLEDAEEEEITSRLEGDDANNDKSAPVGDNREGEITGNNIAGEKSHNGKLLLEGAEPDLNIDDAKSEVDTTESISTTKNLSTEKGSILHVTPGKLEESTSRVPVSPSNKQQKQAQGNVHRSADRVRSVDTLDTTESRDHSSEISGVFGKMSKPPTTRSSYAYDGLVKQFPVQHLESLKNAYTIPEGRTKKGKGLANSSSYGDRGTQHQPHISNENHHVMKESRRNQNKVLETTNYGNPHSRIPLHRSSSQTRYERGRPSNGMHSELHHSTGFLSKDSIEDTDHENMKLLRMIYKLQDQLNKTRYPSGETNGRQSATRGVSYKGNHIPSYHSHDLLEGRYSHHPRCDGRCAHEITWRERHKYSRIPYSAEATSPAHHVDHSCLHCRLHTPSNSPRHVHFHPEELYRSYGGQDYCSSNCSYSSSPQWFTSSKLPLYDSESKSNDQRHMADTMRKYFREKQNLAKRHQRPVAGGAPFITCHKCLKLLQLPADFLLYKKACHQLKCGECSEVLKFSLKNGSHIVSFSLSEVISGRNLPSTSHANYYQYSPAKPISYYDDYGLSVSQSYSSEGDHVFLAQCHPWNGGEYVNPNVSRSTTLEEKITSRYSSTTNARMETDESVDLCSNMSAEKEARPQLKSSLHKLMGYSTPSQVIRGTSVECKGVHTQFRNSHQK